MANLKTELQIFAQLRERIAALYALDPDDEAVIDTASGETGLEDAIASIIRESRHAKAMAEGCCKLASETLARSARLEARADKLRELALEAMQESGLRKVAAPDFTANVRKGKAPLIITREPDGTDPCIFVCEKMTRAWDKNEVREALENGNALDFAYLGNAGQILTVRTK